MSETKRGQPTPESNKDTELERRLAPVGERETRLWQTLEKADRPIVTILKRINKTIQQLFPDQKIKTVDSCSGHVDSFNPNIIIYGTNFKLLSKLDNKLKPLFTAAVEESNKRLQGSKIETDFWRSPINEPAETTAFSQTKDLSRTDLAHSLCYYFLANYQPTNPQELKQILNVFWNEVNKELQKLDGLSTPVEISDKDIKKED